MRKLLILTVVLGVASMASAAMTLVVSDSGDAGTYTDPGAPSDYTINTSDYIWIGVNNDTDGVPGANAKGVFYMGIDVTAGPAPGSWTGAFQQYKPPLVAGAPDNIPYGIVDVMGDGSMVLDLWNLTLDDGDPATFNLAGVLDAKEFHCDALGDVVINLYSSGFQTLDSITIHQVIPEPITMALLGLGGLFLRRRK